MRSVVLAVAVSLVVVGTFVGCSGATAGAPFDSSDAATGVDTGVTANDAAPSFDASYDGATDAGHDAAVDAIWPSDAESVVANSPGGGFTPTPPPGSKCAYGAERFSLVMATKLFAWERCTPGVNPGDPLLLVKGSRVLTPAEVGSVDAAMKKLAPPKDPKLCGADKGVYTVEVKTPRSDITYYDSFYACNGGGKIYVDQIDGVFGAFAALVK
jgi:hypothetical protein